jgi:hypothetical protein
MCEIDEAEMETTFLGGGANASDGNGGCYDKDVYGCMQSWRCHGLNVVIWCPTYQMQSLGNLNHFGWWHFLSLKKFILFYHRLYDWLTSYIPFVDPITAIHTQGLDPCLMERKIHIFNLYSSSVHACVRLSIHYHLEKWHVNREHSSLCWKIKS